MIGVVAHEPPGELSGGESGGAVGALRPRRPRVGRAAALLADACAPAPDTAAAPIGLVLFRLCNNIVFALDNRNEWSYYWGGLDRWFVIECCWWRWWMVVVMGRRPVFWGVWWFSGGTYQFSGDCRKNKIVHVENYGFTLQFVSCE